MRAIWDELRRAFAMTFNRENLQKAKQGRSDLGWAADPHLRKGYLLALPVALLGMVVAMLVLLRTRSLVAFFAAYLPFGFVVMLVWLGVAARSRANDPSRTR